MENKQGINEIHFECTVYPFCPLGGDHYKAEVNVDIEPGEALFDFCEVDWAIKSIGTKDLIIEDLVAAVYELMVTYSPKSLTVTVYAESNKHFPVRVTKHN